MATCAKCDKSVHVPFGLDWEDGEDICYECLDRQKHKDESAEETACGVGQAA